jgi:putative nucleotidyltransferase with HDIG domain
MAETTTITRDEAWALLTEYVQSESLRRHCLSVETAMRAYAEKFGGDPDAWGIVGLIHDFDYEIHPTLDQHPAEGVPILRERGYPEWVIRAILAHGVETGVSPESDLEKTLVAVDELTGFITAVAYVRPSKAVAEVTPQSVRKKMKDKAFARAVSREEMQHGAETLGIDFDTHVQFVIDAMTKNAVALGLQGVASDAP